MARVTLGNRLEVLASSPHLPEGRRQFAASLLAHYQKRRSLTKGRRVWVDRLEAMVEEAKNRDPSEYEALVIEIEDVMTRVESDGWSADFLASIRDQAKRVGARLSPRQQEIFDKIKSENTPDMAASVTGPRTRRSIRPADGFSNPARVRSSVLLPAPFGPSTASTLPATRSNASTRSSKTPLRDVRRTIRSRADRTASLTRDLPAG